MFLSAAATIAEASNEVAIQRCSSRSLTGSIGIEIMSMTSIKIQANLPSLPKVAKDFMKPERRSSTITLVI